MFLLHYLCAHTHVSMYSHAHKSVLYEYTCLLVAVSFFSLLLSLTIILHSAVVVLGGMVPLTFSVEVCHSTTMNVASLICISVVSFLH